MNYELTSIIQKNDALCDIFKSSCNTGTIFMSKLRMENDEKENRKLKQFITREEHKLKYC